MWLCEEEQIIIRYLGHCGENGASTREICRKASTKDAWKEDERWAYRHLGTLKDKKVIESMPSGNYRLPPAKEK
jgi:hypothetical protein